MKIDMIIEKAIDSLESRQGKRALLTGIPTGFHRLDQLTAGLQKSNLITICGAAGIGKRALAYNLAINAAILSSLGFQKDKPLREQSFLIRLIYYKKENELHRNSYFLDYFERHHHEYHRTNDRRPDRRPMVRYDDGRKTAAPDAVSRTAGDALPSPVLCQGTA